MGWKRLEGSDISLSICCCIVLTFRSISMFYISKRYRMKIETMNPTPFKMNNITTVKEKKQNKN